MARSSGQARIDVIIVHYHAAELVRDAVAALRSDAQTTDIELHIIVADNGSTPDERCLLRSLDIDLLGTGTNAGYAGGVNVAFEKTRFQAIVVMNEDVLVLPGCLRALHDALLSGAAVAGPEFYWDRDLIFRLPCTEGRTRRAELLKLAARRSLPKLQLARSAWREHARRHWRAERPLETTSLSGAMMAFRRDAWNNVGAFDSGFRLYFEENDWLRRVSLSGRACMYVPTAKAIHLHNPRLATTPERLQMEQESFVRFGNRYYGETFMRRVVAVSRRKVVSPVRKPVVDSNRFEVRLTDVDAKWPLWIELTISPSGFPAATTLVCDARMESWRLPPMRGVRGLERWLYLRLVDDRGRELQEYAVERPVALSGSAEVPTASSV